MGIIVERLEWTDELTVGNATIDSDHRRLISLINRLDAAIVSGEEPATLGSILDELATCTKAHFSREECLMQRIRYPEFNSHKSQHDGLLSDLTKIQRTFHSGELPLSERTSAFLSKWLILHICTSDIALGQVAASLDTA